MKKFIITITLALLATAWFSVLFSGCTPLVRCEYECRIVYSLDGSVKTQTFNLRMSDVSVPTYVQSNEGLVVSGYPSNFWHETATVYRGSLPIKVEDFEYNLVRKYKASNWDGHEITEKKK